MMVLDWKLVKDSESLSKTCILKMTLIWLQVISMNGVNQKLND